MKVALCLTRFERDWAGIKVLLEQAPAAALINKSPGELLQSLGSLDPDLLLVDARTPREDFQMLLGLAPASATVVLVLPPADANSEQGFLEAEQLPEVYDCLRINDRPSHQQKVIERALERSSLLFKDRPSAPLPDLTPALNTPSLRTPERTWELALRSLSRTLSAGFDAQGLIEPFLDLVVELIGVARVSLLTLDPLGACFTVCASRGLHSPILRAYSHPRKGCLAEWLVREGRPLRRSDASLRSSPDSQDIQRSFDALQATVCIPMAAMGQMGGILAVGSRLNGLPPTEEQIELLFMTGSHVAVALQNIRFHNEIARSDAQHENVLEHMTNGVAAIDETGSITVFNRRAAEILRLQQEEILGMDLRVLPAPLGDYLFSTMTTGESYRRISLSLPGSGIPLEVSSYPLNVQNSSKPLGSVLVLADISERIALEESRRHADRQEVFTRLISQLAHEINNPLVAVKTFADLFKGGFEDTDFISFVQTTVIPEIGRLDSVVSRLVDFVDTNRLQIQNCELAPILTEAVDNLREVAEATNAELFINIPQHIPSVRADAAQFTKAIKYLLQEIISNLPNGKRVAIRIEVVESPHIDTLTIEIHTSAPWIQEDGIDHLFDPLYMYHDQLNLSIPAARKIILEHGGDIEVRAESGGLVTFRILINTVEPVTEGNGLESMVPVDEYHPQEENEALPSKEPEASSEGANRTGAVRRSTNGTQESPNHKNGKSTRRPGRSVLDGAIPAELM